MNNLKQTGKNIFACRHSRIKKIFPDKLGGGGEGYLSLPSERGGGFRSIFSLILQCKFIKIEISRSTTHGRHLQSVRLRGFYEEEEQGLFTVYVLKYSLQMTFLIKNINRIKMNCYILIISLPR